ncbi:Precorrin-2 C(20)-methyltransferase [Nymphon striatum]|nr:Precorrin-2 C(20)-methyltransferase [Nymphon striatum]
MRVERFPAANVYDEKAKEIAVHLSAGEDVVVLCEGDPFFYGSFMYLFERLSSDFKCEIVPGISSLMASAAVLQRPLAARNDVLTITPAPLPDDILLERFNSGDAIAIIKIGQIGGVIQGLEGRCSKSDSSFSDVRIHMQNCFKGGEPVVAIMASGAIIRLLADVLVDKHSEPPVLAIAEDCSSVRDTTAKEVIDLIEKVLSENAIPKTLYSQRHGALLKLPGWFKKQRTWLMRVKAAAEGDFVIAFYNPVSKRRRTQLEYAKGVLLEHRPDNTPVILATNLGRAPDLITVRGLRLIENCPVCMYAGSLVPEEIVAAAPDGAEVTDTAPLNLDEIIEMIRVAEEQGKDVARLAVMATIGIRNCCCCFNFICAFNGNSGQCICCLFHWPNLCLFWCCNFSKRKITWFRTITLLCAFVGVLIVVRPGGGMSSGLLFALMGGCFYAAFLVSTRWLSSAFSSRSLLFSNIAMGTIIMTPWGISSIPEIDLEMTGLIIWSAAGSAFGNLAIVLSSSLVDGSRIAPLIYLQVVYATLFGILFFGDFPDEWTLIGLAVLVTSGFASFFAQKR